MAKKTTRVRVDPKRSKRKRRRAKGTSIKKTHVEATTLVLAPNEN